MELFVYPKLTHSRQIIDISMLFQNTNIHQLNLESCLIDLMDNARITDYTLFDGISLL